MRHYEIVLLIHPDQSGEASSMVERYKALIIKAGGEISRLEDWGRRQLSYPIKKVHKAHYMLMNIACKADTLEELQTSFRYNDAIIRSLILSVKKAITTPSPMLAKETNQASTASTSRDKPSDEEDGVVKPAEEESANDDESEDSAA